MDESNIVVNHEANSLLEIIDTNSNVYQQIQKASNESPVVDLAALSMNQNTNLLSAQADGRLRVWQVDSEALQQDLKTWMAMFDLDVLNGTKEPLSLKYLADGTSVPRTGVSLPKHGKEDPKNEPHVGGNTWAGGTGGSDTAGLGGRGGPYRLDKGHRIHQISQEKKDEVTKEAREKAKKMAQEALAEQLQQIDMTNNEFEAYHKYLNRIESETVQLRQVFQNFEQLSKERSWLKHQSNGEWDDSKLVDGLTGEKNIFKRRGEDPFSSHEQPEPAQNGRLERMLETSMMLMESFAGFESKFDYAIMGHSGDNPAISFVPFGSPPKTKKERLKILQKMVAHSQYCSSGDHTLEAIYESVDRVKDQTGENLFVFVVSDANLSRYGISPKEMARALQQDPNVSAHAIFIASLADEATQIMKKLPQGKGHVCLHTADLPLVFKKIFTSNVTN
ncbi:unnamed protein product [Aphanomyces euteiches]